MAEKQEADSTTIQKTAYDNALSDDPEYYILYDRREDLDSWLDRNDPCELPAKEIVTCWAIESESYKIDESKMDYKNLHRGWKKLKKSRLPINYYSIRDLAMKHRVMHGSWTIVVHTEDMDLDWRRIAKQFVADAFSGLAILAQVTSKMVDEWASVHVITVKNRDFTDEEEIYQLHDALRSIAVTDDMWYAPDVYNELDIDRDNDFNIKIFTYESHYDHIRKEHDIKSTLM